MVLFCILLSYVNISTFIVMHLSTSAHHTQHEMRHLNLQCIPCLIVRNSSVFVFVYQLHYFFHLHVVTWHCTHTPRSLNDDGHTHTHTRAGMLSRACRSQEGYLRSRSPRCVRLSAVAALRTSQRGSNPPASVRGSRTFALGPSGSDPSAHTHPGQARRQAWPRAH